MRLFCAGIETESNGFVSYPTPLADFTVYRGDQPPGSHRPLSAAAVWEEECARLGHDLEIGLLAWAAPSGPTTRKAYETLRDEILDRLRRAGPVDGLLLDLHGAMVADGYPDAEGDLIERCRTVVGPSVPIGVFLDLHCHLTRKMVEQATVIVAMKEWPHLDVPERSREVLDLVVRTRRGEIQPVSALFDCRMIGAYPTQREPMKTFVDRLRSLERTPGILSITLGHGYPWADVPEVGSKMLVIADGDRTRAEALAEQLGREFFALRERVAEKGDCTIEEALDHVARTPDGPILLCEQGDSQLGGNVGDATYVLRKVIERGVGNVVFGPIWDPMSVEICAAVGEGERMMLRIGAKSGPEAGLPVDLVVTVRKVIPNLMQDALGPIPGFPFGTGVWVAADNDVDLILHSVKAGTLRPNVITDFGIDLARKHVVVCKMWRHGESGFKHLVRESFILRTPGAQSLDIAAVPFKLFDRPYWPRVADPFAAA